MSNLPNVPSNLAQQLRDFLQSVRTILLDLSARIANLSARVSQLNGVAYLAKSYVDNVTDDASIDPPSNLVVEVVSWVHKLTWNNIDSTKVSGVEVFHNTTNDVSTAELLATVPYGVEVYRHSVDSVYIDHYYWIRNVTWGGGYSTYVPDPTIHGGYLIERDKSIGEAIDQAMNLLIGDDPPLYSAATVYDAGDIIKWAGADGAIRRYRRKNYDIGNSNVDPSNGSYWEQLGLLVEGEIDGAPTLGVDGNLVVDGTILARHIKADEITGDHINAQSEITLAEGGILTVGDENIVIDSGSNSLVVCRDGGPDQPNPIPGWLYTKMTHGSFLHGFSDGVNVTETGGVRIVDGGGPISCDQDGNAIVTTSKKFFTAPKILLSPAVMPVYRRGFNDEYNFDYNLFVETLSQNSDYTWTFSAKSQLIIAATQVLGIVNAPPVNNTIDHGDNWWNAVNATNWSSDVQTTGTFNPADFLPPGVTWNRLVGSMHIVPHRQRVYLLSDNYLYYFTVGSSIQQYLMGAWMPPLTLSPPSTAMTLLPSGPSHYHTFDLPISGVLSFGAKSVCTYVQQNVGKVKDNCSLLSCDPHTVNYLAVNISCNIYTNDYATPVSVGQFNWIALGD